MPWEASSVAWLFTGGCFPIGSTFFVFSDYMRPAIRLAALMKLHVIYIFTHDSIAVGEDGPTHQPVEQLFSLRAIPSLTVIRPADANETAEAWRIAVENKNGPTAIILTRQNVPVIDRGRFSPATGLRKGAYILSDSSSGKPEVILIATGSEVHLALEVQEKLLAEGVKTRVVSMPSWELFEQQPEDYRQEVLPPDVTKRVSIEAGVTLGWHRYVGREGEIIGIDHFGASAPGNILLKEFGFTSDQYTEQSEDSFGKKEREMRMAIAIAADHAGFCLKLLIVEFLKNLGHDIVDLGTQSEEPVDYPDYARAVAQEILSRRVERGILICGSGVGACAAVNKFPGIRAAICHDTFSAHQGVEDDDLNVLCLGARVIGPELAKEIVRVWLSAAFSGAERHRRRLAKIDQIEKEFMKAGRKKRGEVDDE